MIDDNELKHAADEVDAAHDDTRTELGFVSHLPLNKVVTVKKAVEPAVRKRLEEKGYRLDNLGSGDTVVLGTLSTDVFNEQSLEQL